MCPPAGALSGLPATEPLHQFAEHRVMLTDRDQQAASSESLREEARWNDSALLELIASGI
jgi:hypothetical protein